MAAKGLNLFAGWTPEQWQAYGATGGTFDADNKMEFGTTTESQIEGMQPASSIQSRVNAELVNDSTITPGFFGKDGFGMSDALGLGKLGVGLGNLYLGNKQLGLAEDTFKYNKAARDKEYAANVTKYNNALSRTAAIDKHYGSQTSGTKI